MRTDHRSAQGRDEVAAEKSVAAQRMQRDTLSATTAEIRVQRQ